ncbi:putative ANKRD40 C-terminal-like protein, partial [Loxodonta africana]|uniref:putative ANKRD40 C-terminal-like protein n=1 Tax=Loxodonta africana TaxID=9785 RepID=UPI0030D12771
LQTIIFEFADDLELVLKIRIQSPKENDFIEIELKDRSYQNLLKVSCCELGIYPGQAEKIRKLPNTLLRKVGFPFLSEAGLLVGKIFTWNQSFNILISNMKINSSHWKFWLGDIISISKQNLQQGQNKWMDILRLQNFQETELILTKNGNSEWTEHTPSLTEKPCYNSNAAKMIY